VYWKTMLEKTTPESAQKVRTWRRLRQWRALRDRVEGDAEQNQAIRAIHIAGAECRFPASSTW